MKVLICIPCLLTGGTEIQTLNTVHALVRGGHEVTVACYFEHTPDMVERYRKAGAEVILFSPEGVRVGGYRAILFLYKHLRRTIKTIRPDVTHVQYMAPGATVILLLWLMGVRNIIATAHTAADIYRDLRLIHFLQRHCLRAFTCITERAECSFFGSSQLYSPDLVLGRRNHFTIYNALPFRTSERLKVKGDGGEVNGQQLIANSQKPSTTQDNSHTDFTDYTEDSCLAGNVGQHELDTIAQNGKSLRPCTSGVLTEGSQLTAHGSQPTDSQLSTLNATQDNSHTDFTDYTDSCKSLRPCTSGVSTEGSQLTAHGSQPTDSQLSTLNATQELSHTDFADYTDSCKSLRPCTSGVSTEGSSLTANSQGLCQRARCKVTYKSLSERSQSSTTELLTAKSQESNTKLTLGVVSRLEPIKGMDLVVPAFAEVLGAHPEVRLLVVGDGTLRASMEEQATALGCAEAITFVGRQPQEELSQWYSQMDIVLMPSRSEGFGLTAIEAMAHGCVMVASDVGGLPEVVRDGICGLLHRTEDIADMVEKICFLIGDEALYTLLRAQSLVEVGKYSFERYAALMNDLYNKLGR